MEQKKRGRKAIDQSEKKVPVTVFVKAKHVSEAKERLKQLVKEYN